MGTTFQRSFTTAAWLGWQIESNWTAPLLFLAFSIIKPISSVLILVFMYHAVSQSGSEAPTYTYIYLGNTFYIYVGSIITSASYSILDDRERYRTLKYLHIAPISIPIYLVGRALARFIIGTIAVFITLLVGIFFFCRMPVNPHTIDWSLFWGAMVLGLISLTFMGIIIGVWTLTIRSEPWFVGETVGAALYFFSGAIFPISLLPQFLQPIGCALPVTY